MKEYLTNPITASAIVFIMQILFLYFRTLNVIYTSRLQILPSILTGAMVGFCWLVSVTVGVNALMDELLLPIIFHFLGGAIGTYLGLLKEKKKYGKNRQKV